MKRREFVVLVGGALAAPLGFAQQPGKVYRVGFLGASKPTPEVLKDSLEPFRQGMRERGWIEGTNYAIEARWADGRVERHAIDAAALTRLGVDVFLAALSPGIRAAMEATPTTPVVMVAPTFPERSGFIASYARPGGSVTGLSYDAGTTPFVKQLDYLRQIVRGTSRVAMIVPESFSNTLSFDETRGVAKDMNVEMHHYAVRESGDLEPTFARIARERMQAVLIVADGMIVINASRVAQLALTYRLPLSSQWQGLPAAGALLSYGADIPDLYRRAAGYVDRIFRGAKPSELPVERPTKFKLILNLQTAKALGLTISQPVLLAADEVIR